ncbi:fructose PTS transporter subunit IIA [Bacillus sonorensis]|uniref:Fructose-specific phosphotransferase system EIIA component n=2 Tax=Bacillus sonorensis TaxID=119858 RepID=M5PCT2_9BACI|nr:MULTISPECIES: fructose PTS transporter subunit IIA [Bacillus]TWK79453.1 PTS system fructose-specific EIIABC component [Bacillus paralicheniformis]ASB90786.1 Protein-N(pi)-phosphohistidine--sugar phosphotransferase [Bacillus sonorensis]EME73177.1 fructose-specific phosphotransferase system EIIA component [Bacillus sonorensis L12]MCY8026575.1 fructose PTS transporter subunit IIA [Bacillus sonorensis]MCY8270398.1 fructose PTS transporter subunit IIA [Bacillus sonorensis]
MSTTIFVKKEHICLHEELSSQAEVFDRLAEIAYDSGIAASKEAVVNGLAKRETESTTGFIDGFAIPHTKLEDIKEAAVLIMKNKTGIEWNALDQTPVTFIIALFIPDAEANSTHLQLLSSLSRMLVHDDVRRQLLEAESPEAIQHTISAYIS